MNFQRLLAVPVIATLVTLAGCKSETQKSPDVTDAVRKSLDDAGLKSVSVSDDRDKGVVTLGGKVNSPDQKAQAESLAKPIAGGQVVADEIAVIPDGAGSDARAVNSDIDNGIKKNLDAALIQNQLHKNVKYAVKNGVVTLTGEVNSDATRSNAQQVASAVPNVVQVVNDLQVKDRKATSTH